MKYYFILLALILTAGSLLSQNNPQPSFPDTRDPAEVIRSAYPDEGLLVLSGIYRPMAASTEDDKYFYSYDDNGRILSYYTQHFESGIWKNKTRYNYSYDSFGNLVQYLRQEWQNASWAPYLNYTYTYDSRKNLIFAQYQYWSQNTWINDLRFFYSFNTSNKLTEWNQQNWINGEWLNFYRSTYTYSNGNLSNVLQKVWNTGAWDNLGRVSNFYDTPGNLVLSINEYWLNSAWVNYQKLSYTYDINRNMLSKISENWEAGVWKKKEQLVHTYNANTLARMTIQIWFNNTWINSAQTTYIYDASNNLTSEFSEVWRLTAWENSYNHIYQYDGAGNSILASSYSWNNGWVLYEGHLQVYYNQGADNNIYSCKEVFVEYDFFTDAEALPIAAVYSLENNYPNPFNPSTTIKYTVPELSRVKLMVYNSLGETLSELKNGIEYPGTYQAEFNAAALPSGVYFYSLVTEPLNGGESFRAVKKMILLK